MITRRNALAGGGAAVLAGMAVSACGRDTSYDETLSSVWAAREPRDDRDLDYLIHYAVLAANSHNTQAWRFDREESRIAIRPDFSRRTPAADPDDHHLFASLGCAAENLRIAASAAGTASASAFVDEGGGHVEIDLAGKTSEPDPLFDAILERQSTRSEYDGRSVAADELRLLEQAAASDACRVVLIERPAMIEQALEFVVAANTRQLESPDFVSELKTWIRFNAAQAVATRDGLYAACSGNPTLPPWLGRLIFGFVATPDSENDRYAGQIRSSSGLAVFVSEKDDKAHWVEAGRACQRFALQATALGIRHAFVNQPVEVAETRARFAEWLGLGGLRPDLVMRYGYAPPMPKSLRRPVAEVIGQPQAAARRVE